ncbi:MAG: hypothetical protein Q9217_003168 [Psora testacea]
MTSSSDPRLQHLTAQTASSPSSPSTLPIPAIHHIAGDSTGQRIKDFVCIITGTSSPLGIGRATAHQYAHNGARAIYLCDASGAHLTTHQRDLQSSYPTTDIHVRIFDAADENAVKAVVADAVAKYGRLDIYFANAGVVGSNTLFPDIHGDDFMRTLRTNVLSVFLAIKYAAPAMRLISSPDKKVGVGGGGGGRGSIIATASVAGLRSNAGSSDYSASKAAVISLVQTTAFQLAGTGVRVNAILPGLIETGMTSRVFEGARRKGTEGKIGLLNPMRRGGVADEIARVALFLGSGEASYVNGQAWAVDGGLSAGLPFVPGKLA